MEEELSESEKETRDWLIALTKDKLHKCRIELWATSSVIFIVAASMAGYFLMCTNMDRLTAVLIAGQFFTVFGAILAVLGAYSSNPTIALISMVRQSSNTKLFFELMKSREITEKGLIFIGLGFLITTLAMLINAFNPFSSWG